MMARVRALVPGLVQRAALFVALLIVRSAPRARAEGWEEAAHPWECSVVGVGPPNSAFSLILPSRAGVSQTRSPSPEHLSRLSVLGVPGEAETLLLPLTVLEGPLPVPSRLCPHCPQESLERTHQHPVLVEGASPRL